MESGGLRWEAAGRLDAGERYRDYTFENEVTSWADAAPDEATAEAKQHREVAAVTLATDGGGVNGKKWMNLSILEGKLAGLTKN